jgi:hypothetical protein
MFLLVITPPCFMRILRRLRSLRETPHGMPEPRNIVGTTMLGTDMVDLTIQNRDFMG